MGAGAVMDSRRGGEEDAMNIAVVGAGRIGGNTARLLAAAGHDLKLAFSRDPRHLVELADAIGPRVSVGTPMEAVRFSEVVIFSVPWSVIPLALEQMDDLGERIVIDTTNPYGSGPMPAEGQTAAQFNAARMPGARYTKSFNTLTARFQVEAAGREGEQRVVQWLCGDDEPAKRIVADLIAAAGYVPVDLGGTADSAVMEAPRRPGAVYGEEYRLAEAEEVVAAVRVGRPIPPTPRYDQPTWW
jgi:predicted dinucleotide-binding enzyme